MKTTIKAIFVPSNSIKLLPPNRRIRLQSYLATQLDKMQSFNLVLASLAALGLAMPITRRDDAWQVTRFSAGVAPHSSVETVSFNLQIGSGSPATCSGLGSAGLSSGAYLFPVNGTCDDGSVSFEFSQVEDQAIKLDVLAGNIPRSHTSDPGVVEESSTGDSPFDTTTSYTGPQDFTLDI